MFSFQGTSNPAQEPCPKAKAKASGRAGNRRPAAEVAPVMRNGEAETGIAGKRSTKTGSEAWKQAKEKADKRKSKDRRHTGMSHCEVKAGRKGNEETEAE